VLWWEDFVEWHEVSGLKLIEVFAPESEETMIVQKFSKGDQVVSSDGNLFGTVLGEAKKDAKGTHYKVIWENSAETINLASTLTPVRESQKAIADTVLAPRETVVQEEPFNTETFHLLETLGWAESAIKADIFKLVTTMDRSGHKVQDAKELLEAARALVEMLERRGA
jgi:hypothetical protein